MADYASEVASWFTWLSELSIVPSEYQYIIRIISAFFVTLGLVPIVPIALLVIYDVGLWLWRLAAASRRARSLMHAGGTGDFQIAASHGPAPNVSIAVKKTN
ncbi:ef3ae08d-3632-41e3-b67d-2e8b74b4fa19 [Thermothielavioides terrestris]|uniref:Ef3ae08d-3632-41e3-b67d-2e8b74b4fa19 n=1 Tax=Thermothielavioides terrestris TaxID=2587410 RepID=A0A3S4AUD1_9PEZI|nr:ef3ae08d-3632-41e3-b67d-2e8b74b4fa19 [Thermothielavioides terrestris]